MLGDQAIVTGSGRYRLEAEVDAARFSEAVERARRASGSPGVADLWSRALRDWRGSAFGDLADHEAIQPEAVRLDAMRVEATEAWFDARLAAGEGRELVVAISEAVADNPLREGFRAQQMTALSRAGRQAEALQAFQDFRSGLTEVGLEPSQRLVVLDRQIATGEVPRAGARRTLRGYEIGDQLGEGAFGKVWAATQAAVGRPVAIKQIHADLADDPDFVRHFEYEAHLIAHLEHPHIVPLYDYWREPGSAYLVMRYLPGGTLGARIADEPLDLSEAVAMTQQIAAALDSAHRAGVIHRDVKPANVLLDEEGNAYLSDFGIAVEEAERVDPEAWLSTGSPVYAAPEQLQRRGVGPAADVYALGVTVYEALAGEVPFPRETSRADLLVRQLRDPLPLLRGVRSDLPAAIDTVLRTATAKDPDDRYSSAGSFAQELAVAANLDGEASRIGPVERNPYKGLRAFDEADAADFVGRNRLVTRLLEVLDRSRALAVVGPSGSGKSSVVRAGLLPALRSGRLVGSETWLVTSMVPGQDPYADLANALERVAVDLPADPAAVLRRSPRGLASLLRRSVPDQRQVVLLIDQFEELFTLTADSKTRAAFLESLVFAASEDRPLLRIVLTLRADFYDHPLRHERLARLIEHATVAIPPLAPDELERAIVEPAASVGAGFEPGLLAAITADVADQPGSLPLLQYVLTALFEQREGAILTAAAYRRLGGVSGALTRRAEQMYDGMADGERHALRQLMPGLCR